MALTAGFGFTVTKNTEVAPEQLFRVGVIVYVTVPGVAAVLVNSCEGIFPEPLAVLPVIPALAEEVHT